MCQPDRSLYATETLIDSCAHTRHSDVGSSLKGGNKISTLNYHQRFCLGEYASKQYTLKGQKNNQSPSTVLSINCQITNQFSGWHQIQLIICFSNFFN